MKLTLALLAVVVATGCVHHKRTIRFESDPPGGRVFMQAGETKKKADGGRNYLGTTPCTWTTFVNRDGTFKTPDGEIPYYSAYVQGVVVFTCEPPGRMTNLYTKKEIFRSNANYQPGNSAPDGVFFDLTKP